MKIHFAQTCLCSDAQEPSSLAISARRKLQSESIIGAANARLFDRGNCAYTIAFSVETEHRSALEAQAHLLRFCAQSGGLGPATLSFELDAKDAQPPESVSFAQAVLQKSSATLDGFRSVHSYEFAASATEAPQ